MKVQLDSEKCVGHGRCYELAPDVYGEDERGHCVILREEVPADFQKQALRGESNCPERALQISQASS